jgi:hypothetical protein
MNQASWQHCELDQGIDTIFDKVELTTAKELEKEQQPLER